MPYASIGYSLGVALLAVILVNTFYKKFFSSFGGFWDPD